MVTIENIVAAVAETTGTAMSDIKARVPGEDVKRARLLVIVYARFYLFTFREIGAWFNMDAGSIQYFESFFEHENEHDKKFEPCSIVIFEKLNWQGWKHQAQAMKAAKENNL